MTWNEEHAILLYIITGAFVLGAGAYPWAWWLYCRLERYLSNHLQHRLARIEKTLHLSEEDDDKYGS